MPNLDNISPQVQVSLISCPSLDAHLGEYFFPRGVHISWEKSTGGVLISQEISTGGVLFFGEYLFSVTPALKGCVGSATSSLTLFQSANWQLQSEKSCNPEMRVVDAKYVFTPYP